MLIFNLRYRQAPTVHAPNERELSSAYSHVLQIGGFQIERIRAKAQISLISIGMETLFQMFFVLN